MDSESINYIDGPSKPARNYTRDVPQACRAQAFVGIQFKREPWWTIRPRAVPCGSKGRVVIN